MRPLTDLRELVRMLAARAPDLTRELFPAGRRDGDEWRVGSLAGEPGRSLAVRLTGPRAGVWCDFAAGEAGDALDLVAAVLFAGDKRQAVAWSRRWLGLDSTADPAEAERRRRLTERALARSPEPEHGAVPRQRRAAALAKWLSAQARIAGTPVDAYLRARAIDLGRLGRQPRALRFHPALPCLEADGRRLPAMVALIVNADGAPIGVHCTWIERDRRSGTWRKAAVEHAKKVYGQQRGGMIRLWRGASGKPLADAPDGDIVAIAEGIEDALTVALECPEWRVLASICSGNLPHIVLPPAIAEVVLIGQRDGENPGVRRARDAALDRWLREGRAVREALPPTGFKDWNAWAMAEATAGAAMPASGRDGVA
jgi:hypothetical protein